MQSPNRFLSSLPSLSLLVIVLLSVATWTCKIPEGPLAGNTLPDTRLANVPANDTIAKYIHLGVFPEQILYWLGDDPDGYVIAYRYRWSNINQGVTVTKPWSTILNIVQMGGANLDNPILVKGSKSPLVNIYKFITNLSTIDSALIRIIGDSLATRRPFAVPYKTGIVLGDTIYGGDPKVNLTPTIGQFIFDSPADSNLHRFEVASIDNDDAVDPTPAQVHFWTLRSRGPIALISTQPANGQFAIRCITEKFLGLPFTFRSLDPTTFEIEYSWAVDDTVDPASWSPWSPVASAFVTASHFKPILTGLHPHKMYVKARNRFGVVGNIAVGAFTAVVPAIDDPIYVPRILIINSDLNGNGTPGRPDSNQIKAFYTMVMDSLGKTGKFDLYTTATPRTPVGSIPPQSELGKYSAILYLQEQTPPVIGTAARLKLDADKQAILRDYLNIGGKFLFSAPPDIRNVISNYETWAMQFFFIVSTQFAPFIQNPNLDFIGAKGLLGYPDVMIDPAKLAAADSGAIRNIAINYPRGFAQSISVFDSKANDPLYENQPLGIRFLAPPATPPCRQTFSVIHFGFPLFYGNTSQVIALLRKAFSDINE